MAHAIEFPAFRGHPKMEIPLHRLAWSAALVSLALLLCVLSAQALKGYLVDAPAQEISVVSMSETRERPAEWRWERKAITFDHMFRNNQPTQNVDWIRNSGALPSPVRTTR